MNTKTRLEDLKQFVQTMNDDGLLFEKLNMLEEDIKSLRYFMHLARASKVVDSWPQWKREYCREEIDRDCNIVGRIEF